MPLPFMSSGTKSEEFSITFNLASSSCSSSHSASSLEQYKSLLLNNCTTFILTCPCCFNESMLLMYQSDILSHILLTAQQNTKYKTCMPVLNTRTDQWITVNYFTIPLHNHGSKALVQIWKSTEIYTIYATEAITATYSFYINPCNSCYKQ